MDVTQTTPARSAPQWREVRDPHTGRLLCRVDFERELLEFVDRRRRTLIDLAELRAEASRA